MIAGLPCQVMLTHIFLHNGVHQPSASTMGPLRNLLQTAPRATSWPSSFQEMGNGKICNGGKPPHLSCCATISVFDCWSHKGVIFFHVIKAITVIILNLSFLKGARTNKEGFAYKLSLDVGEKNHSRPARQTDEAVRRHYEGTWAGATLLCSPLLVTL